MREGTSTGNAPRRALVCAWMWPLEPTQGLLSRWRAPVQVTLTLTPTLTPSPSP